MHAGFDDFLAFAFPINTYQREKERERRRKRERYNREGEEKQALKSLSTRLCPKRAIAIHYDAYTHQTPAQLKRGTLEGIGPSAGDGKGTEKGQRFLHRHLRHPLA